MMLTSAASASAYNFTVDGFYYDIVSISDLTCAVTNNDNVYDKEYFDEYCRFMQEMTIETLIRKFN